MYKTPQKKAMLLKKYGNEYDKKIVKDALRHIESDDPDKKILAENLIVAIYHKTLKAKFLKRLEWRPIKSAPMHGTSSIKDREENICGNGKLYMDVCQYPPKNNRTMLQAQAYYGRLRKNGKKLKGYCWYKREGGKLEFEPTHWRPIARTIKLNNIRKDEK